MFKCPRCSQNFNSYNSLSKHTNAKYKLSGESLYREYHGISEIITCKCGCGTPTKWRIDTGYNDYIAGHNSKGENNVMFGKKHSEEAKKNISNTRKEKFANGEYTFIDSVKWAEAQKKVWESPEYKKKMKESREASGWRNKISAKMSGKNHPFYGKKRPEHSALMKTPEMMSKIFAKRSMTDIEQKMSAMLDMLNIEYQNQFFISNNGTTVSYDFKLIKYPLLIETDGDYWHGGPGADSHVPFLTEVTDKDTLKTQMATDRGYTVLRFWGSDILNNPQKVITELLSEINKTSP
jgi:very-short-patch-repair endonuclease